MSRTETALTLVALVAAAITPNVFVTGGLHLAPTPAVARYVLLPAVLVQFAVLVYARRIGCHRLVNRLVVGAWVGLVATTGLDVVRQPGTFLGYLPHDEARMAGEMILGGGHHGAASAHGVGPAPAGTAHGQGEPRAGGPSGQDQPPPRGHDGAVGGAAGHGVAGAARPEHGKAVDGHVEQRGGAADTRARAGEHAAPAGPEVAAGAGSAPGQQDTAQGGHRGGGSASVPHGGSAHRQAGVADVIGYAFHYWNGASFAVIYALLFGRTPWWGPLLYAVLFIESGMVVFMRAAMPPLTPGIVVVSLLAHVVYGLVLGVLFSHFLREEGPIVQRVIRPMLQEVSP